MKDTITRSNYGDFRQRYGGSFGWFLLDNGTKRLVNIIHCDSDGATFTDVLGVKYTAATGGGMMFEFLPVTHGWVNSNDGNAYYMNRIPARQWSRGITRANTHIMKLTKTTFARVEITLETLEKVFNGTLPGNIAWKEFIDGKRDSCAVSRAFTITSKTVYFFNQIIGSFDKQKLQITLESSLVMQELSDAVKRQNIQVTINV